MDIHSSLQTLDVIVIAVYVTVLIGIGMWVSFRRRGSEDLFLAGRSLSWPNVGLSIFGTNVSPTFMIAGCGVAYTTGMVSANFEWLSWWFLMLLAMLFAPYYLTTNISTMPQFMRLRFGEATYGFLSWYSLFCTVILWLGGTLNASGILLGQIMNLAVVVIRSGADPDRDQLHGGGRPGGGRHHRQFSVRADDLGLHGPDGDCPPEDRQPGSGGRRRAGRILGLDPAPQRSRVSLARRVLGLSRAGYMVLVHGSDDRPTGVGGERPAARAVWAPCLRDS